MTISLNDRSLDTQATEERFEPGGENGADMEWQRLWFSALAGQWSSVAIVPTEPGLDVQRIAEELAAVGRRQRGPDVEVITAVGARIDTVQPTIDAIGAASRKGQLVLVPIDPMMVNPASTLITSAVSGILIVVCLRETRLSSIRYTVRAVGKGRVVGTVVLEDTGAEPGREARGLGVSIMR
jgi:hypothetical protein